MRAGAVWNGAPGEIRTPDLMLRRHSLYPAELRARPQLGYLKSRFLSGFACVPVTRTDGRLIAFVIEHDGSKAEDVGAFTDAPRNGY